MLAVALPMWLLYEGAVIVARINDKRKLSSEPDYDSMSDDEASVIDEASSIDEPEAIEPPDDD